MGHTDIRKTVFRVGGTDPQVLEREKWMLDFADRTLPTVELG